MIWLTLYVLSMLFVETHCSDRSDEKSTDVLYIRIQEYEWGNKHYWRQTESAQKT
jgi:hypothetical protein